MPEEIDAILAGREPPGLVTNPKFFDPSMAGLMQRFIAGMYVTGSMNGDPKKLKPDLERLVGLQEVWVMCFRAPKFNQWRLMGRFTAFNRFVGLGLYRRQFLDGERHYHARAQEFVTHWDTTNAQTPIHVGKRIEDYISLPVRDPYAPNVL